MTRDYQLDETKTTIKYGRKLLLSKTASGKSLIIYLLARYYNKKTNSHSAQLSCRTKMSKDFIDYGYQKDICKIYSGQVFDADITTTTWQSFEKALKRSDAIVRCSSRR